MPAVEQDAPVLAEQAFGVGELEGELGLAVDGRRGCQEADVALADSFVPVAGLARQDAVREGDEPFAIELLERDDGAIGDDGQKDVSVPAHDRAFVRGVVRPPMLVDDDLVRGRATRA